MHIAAYIRSLTIGVIIALPVGPVGALSVRRVLSYGRTAGLVSALGGCFADILYVIVVRLGLTHISESLIRHEVMLRSIGVTLIVLLGTKLLLTGRLTWNKDIGQFRYDGIFTSSFFLSVVNPSMLFSLTILFAVMGFGHGGQDTTAAGGGSLIIQVIWVFAGSAACWAILTTIIDKFRARMTPPVIDRLGRVAGGLIIVFGAAALIR
jgi:threonine/homoserine/homoserine lactone efflux protein